MTTPQIARAFLVNERTLAQRIVRAKRKIVTAGIALTVPPPDALTERLTDVLAVVALMYNEGFVSSDGPTQDRDLAGDAVWLAGVVATSLPTEAEAWGLAALLSFQHARAAARFDDAGRVGAAARPGPDPLGRRDDPGAEEMLERAAALHAPGPLQIQAAIAACHATSPSWAETDWLQIVTLYDVLGSYDPSPSSGSTAPSRSPGSAPTTSHPRWPRSTPSPTGSTATTSSTPPAPSCSPPWAATTRPTRPTPAPWS